MARELKSIEVDEIPEMARIAEDVAASGEPAMLRRNGKDLAMVMPVTKPRKKKARRKPTKEDLEAFYSSAGSWADVDTDKLIADIYESRRLGSRSLLDP